MRETTLFRGLWLVEDIDVTLADLIGAHEREIPELLFVQRLEPIGPSRWEVVEQDNGTTYVTVNIACVPWSDPVRHRSRRSTAGAR